MRRRGPAADRRIASIVVFFVVSAASLGALAGLSIATGTRCGARNVDGWTKLAVDGLDGPITSYVVAPSQPDRMFASDGRWIARSLDGGCSWERVYEFPSLLPEDVPFANLEPAIADLSIPWAEAGSDRVYARVTELPAYEGVPHVLVSRDAGASWTLSDQGLPPVGKTTALALAPSDPDRLYLWLSFGPDPAKELYRSDDGGATWQPAAELGDALEHLPGQPSSVNEVVVDPLRSSVLWATTNRGLYVSKDSGLTWTQVEEVPFAAGAIQATEVQGSSVIDVFSPFSASSMRGFRSVDGGRTWVEIEASEESSKGIRVRSVARGDGPDDLIVSSSGTEASVFRLEGEEWVPIRFRDPALHSVSSDLTDGRHFYAASDEDLWVYEGTPEGEAIPTPTISLPPVVETPCPRWETPPPYFGPVEPAPKTDGPIYISLMEGFLVEFDRFGQPKIAAEIPRASEGIALDQQDRVLVTTRFTNSVVRYDETDASVELIATVRSAEGPAFDKDGRFFVANNASINGGVVTNAGPNEVYMMDPPLEPNTFPELIHSFSDVEFIEDVKVVPDGYPFSGDVLVLLNTLPERGNPTGIARLTRTEDGWERTENFVDMFPNASSAGIAFQSNGHLLVATIGGAVLEYGPTGKYLGVFACVPASLLKIDITHNDYVYLTAEGARVIRLDPTGRRMMPDFSALDFGDVGVGIAVPHFADREPPGGSFTPPDKEPVLTGLGSGPGGPPQAPPAVNVNPQPRTETGAQGNPQTQPATQAQPQAQQQGQQQSQAQSALVKQRQEQPQMAFVHASRTLKEQATMGNAMVRAHLYPDDPLSGVTGLRVAVALGLIAVFGFASALQRRTQVRRIWGRDR